jgi:hypothetical protein
VRHWRRYVPLLWGPLWEPQVNYVIQWAGYPADPVSFLGVDAALGNADRTKRPFSVRVAKCRIGDWPFHPIEDFQAVTLEILRSGAWPMSVPRPNLAIVFGS